MPKAKPDHREQVEFKFGPKERRLLDDFQLNQSFKTGGGVLSDLGTGISSLISPFISGGDAGLLMALMGAVVVDKKLDDSGDESLQGFVDSVDLYSPYNFGAYPDWRTGRDFNFAGPTPGTIVIFCDPADFPSVAKHWKIRENIIPPWAVFNEYEELDLRPYPHESVTYETILSYLDEFTHGPHQAKPNPAFLVWTNELKMRYFSEFGQDIDPSRGGPWRSMQEALDYCFENFIDLPWQTVVPEVPGLTYDDSPPTLFDLQYYHNDIYKKYVTERGCTGTGWEHFTTIVWNNQIDAYKEGWKTLDLQRKMITYYMAKGPKRIEMTNLLDLLSAINIPGVEGIVDFAAAGVDTAVDWATDFAALPTLPSTYSQQWPHCPWPKQHIPPKSIYKYETVHLLVEGIKIAVPWYLGTKLAISAAGAVIPG